MTLATRLPSFALALALLVPALAHALPPTSWVLSVGNNRGDADEIELLYAEDDARTMSEVMQRLGGVPADRVSTLTGADADGVRAALRIIEARIAETAGDAPSALFVYYSGHSDADALHLDGTRLPLQELVESVRAASARTRILVLDACRSGGASRVKGVAATGSFDLDFVDEAMVEGLAVITSSTAREASLESDRLRGSFFTHFFIGGLRGAADADADGRVTLGEAYAHAYAETVRASGRTTVVQHPTFAVDMKGKGQVVLSRPGTGRDLGRIALPDRKLYLIAEGVDGRLVAEVKPVRDGARVALPARRYQVQRRAATEFRTYDVELRAGQTVALAGLPYESVEYDRLVRKRGGEKRWVQGFALSGGVASELVPGEGMAPEVVLAYGIDLPDASLGVRARVSGQQSPGVDLERRRTAIGLGLTVERYIDFDWISVSFGLLVEGSRHDQVFADGRNAPDGVGYGFTVSSLFGFERRLFGGLSLRLEGGPGATLLPVVEVQDGAPVGTALDARAFDRGTLGVVWRL